MAINPFAVIGQADPFPHFAQARSEDPIGQLQPFGVWSLARYEDCVEVLRNPEVFSSDGARYAPPIFRQSTILEERTPSMLVQDPPNHTRLRGLVSRAFTPRMVAQLEPRIRALAEELLAPVAGRGTIDLIDDFAVPLPVIVIAEMLGVPPEDRADFKRWSDALAATLGAGLGNPAGVIEAAVAAREEFVAYFEQVFAVRRREPRGDLVSNLLKLEAEGESLTPDELMAMCILLLAAGNETTTNLIGNTALLLAERPELQQRLRDEPALIPSAVEEVLRFAPAVQATVRFPKAETQLKGQTIGPGQAVICWLASANRDEAVFPNPEEFDITRAPNKHLTFGMGIHFCLGAPLARMEGQIALEAMLRHLPNWRRADDAPLERIPSFIFHGVKHLPLAFDAAVPA